MVALQGVFNWILDLADNLGDHINREITLHSQRGRPSQGVLTVQTSRAWPGVGQ